MTTYTNSSVLYKSSGWGLEWNSLRVYEKIWQVCGCIGSLDLNNVEGPVNNLMEYEQKKMFDAMEAGGEPWLRNRVLGEADEYTRKMKEIGLYLLIMSKS